MNMTRLFALDLMERAGKAFAQSAVSFIAVQWAASGLGVDLFDYAAWQKLVVGAAAAGLAGVLSLVQNIRNGIRNGTASSSKTVAAAYNPDTGAHTITTLPISTAPDQVVVDMEPYPPTSVTPVGELLPAGDPAPEASTLPEPTSPVA